MKVNKILVSTSGKKYTVYVGNNIINKTSLILKKRLPNIKKVAIVYDDNLPKKVVKSVLNRFLICVWQLLLCRA